MSIVIEHPPSGSLRVSHRKGVVLECGCVATSDGVSSHCERHANEGGLSQLAAVDQQTKKPLEGIRPRYYRNGKIEVWDFIEDQQLGFLAGNVVKYLCRASLKGGVVDLEKARTYLDKLIAVEKENR